MTGLSRWSIAAIGLVVGAIAVIASTLLVGAASLCGMDENQPATGYCGASITTQLLLVGAPALTILVGYGLSLRFARLTPIAIAALCALAEGVIALAAGY